MNRLPLILLALVAPGCGYHFVNRSQSLPTGGRKVFAPTFANNSAEAGLEVPFTNAFREELENAGVDGDSSSQVIARGTVSAGGGPSMLAFPPNATGAPILQTYRADVTACVALMDGPHQLAQTCVNGSEEYSSGPDPIQAQLSGVTDTDALDIEARKRLALRRLAKRLMKEAFERLATDF